MNRLINRIVFLILLASGFSLSQWSTDPNNNLIVGYGQDPHICSDSAGGCYITYNYETTFYPQKLAVERLDKYGYKPWIDRKQILGELPEQWQAEIIEDGEGGVIVSYQDNEWIPPSYFNTKVRVQKIDSAGNFLWGQTGVRVSLSETNQGGQEIISDGNGGCIIIWGDTLAQIRINRINSLGERLWGDSGKVIETNPIGYTIHLSSMSRSHFAFCYSRILYGFDINGEVSYRDSLPYRILNITSDELGGVAASWKGGSSNNIKIHSQRKDSLGNNLWQEPYVEIADSLYINSPIYVREINGYYYYYWWGFKNGIQLVAQYQTLRADGTILFDQGSLPVSNYPVDALFGNILASDSATYLLIWQDYRPDDGVFGQRKDTLNNTLWNLNDVPIYTELYSELHAITDCAGGAIGLGWHQLDFTFRVFKISKNGILGEVITNIDNEYKLTYTEDLILYQNFPNPYNSSTTIQFHLLTESKISIDLYNVLGEKMQTIADGVYPQGMNSILLSSDNLPSGIYLYKLQTETGSLTKKLIIIK